MHIQMLPVTSSQIEAIGYDEFTSTLAIRFKGGATYHYANVTEEMYSKLRSAESVGSHFYKHIKPFADKYPLTKQASEHKAA